MTKGSGCSDCFRVGVTYGYREYLRKGPGQVKLRRKFVGPQRHDGLAESFNVQNIDLEHSAHMFLLHIPPQNRFAVFLRDRISRKL